MKKIVLLSIILSLLFIQVPSEVGAKSPISEEELDLYLQENLNVPIDVINRYNYDQKENVYQNNAVYISTKFTNEYLSEEDLTAELNSDISANNVTPYSLSNFGQYFDIYSTTPRATNQVAFFITYSWYFSENPYWNLTEKFGIAWTDNFRIRTGSVKSGYTYEAQCSGTGDWEIDTTSTTTFYNGIDGVGWERKLFEGKGCSKGTLLPKSHYGWGQVIIERAKTASLAGDEVISMVVWKLLS